MSNDMIVPDTVAMAGFEMKPRNLAEAMRFCEIMADSDLVPKDYKGKPGNIMVAIQLGSELGMTPMRALKSIAVINGRPSIWGDEMLAMVLASPMCEFVDESGSTDTLGVCTIKRKGHPEFTSKFSMDDARLAGLIDKPGPWKTNRPRMLKLRARGFGLRDKFADVLAGLITAEEAMDIPRVAVDADPLPTAEPMQSTLKDKLKAKLIEPPMPASSATQTAPPPDESTLPEEAGPLLDPLNICEQFELCESTKELDLLKEGWFAESERHTKDDRGMVKAAAEKAESRLEAAAAKATKGRK